MHRSWKLAVAVSAALTLFAGCGDNSTSGETRAADSSLVSGGVRATSAHYKLSGGVGQGGGTASSSSFTSHGAHQ